MAGRSAPNRISTGAGSARGCIGLRGRIGGASLQAERKEKAEQCERTSIDWGSHRGLSVIPGKSIVVRASSANRNVVRFSDRTICGNSSIGNAKLQPPKFQAPSRTGPQRPVATRRRRNSQAWAPALIPPRPSVSFSRFAFIVRIVHRRADGVVRKSRRYR